MKTPTSKTILNGLSIFLESIWFFFPGLLILALGFVIFSFLPQGIDLLQQSFEHNIYGKILIIIGVSFWAFTSWYTSRILAYNNDTLFEKAPKLTTTFPRLIGFLVFTVIGISLFRVKFPDSWPYHFIATDVVLYAVIYLLSEKEKKKEKEIEENLNKLKNKHHQNNKKEELALKAEEKNEIQDNNYRTKAAIIVTFFGLLLLLYLWDKLYLNLLSIFIIQLGAIIWVSFRSNSNKNNVPLKKDSWINKSIQMIYFNRYAPDKDKKTKEIEEDKKIKEKADFFHTERNIFIVYQLTAITAIIFYFIIIFNIPFGRKVGSFIFVLFAFGILLGAGNILAFLSFKSKTNWHFIVISIIAIAGLVVEPHFVRTIPLESTNEYSKRPDLKTYLERWVNDPIRANILAQNSITEFPVFFVLADGGASRSGYWTAGLLSKLHDTSSTGTANDSYFQQHLLGLAGASGGSVGNISFLSALVAQRKHPQFKTWELSTNFLKTDFFTHTLARLLGPEFVKCLVNPLFDDRAEALEKSMEYPGSVELKSKIIPNIMSGDINQLFVRDGFTPPIFCINTTRMQDGTPAIISNIRDESVFEGRKDVLNLLPCDEGMRISTAIVLGARFPYLSPAGRIKDQYFVDGGYFDNSGAGPIFEIIRKIKDLSSKNDSTFLVKALRKLTFHVIHIQNNPLKSSKFKKVHPFTNDLAAPLFTLIGSYGAQTSFNDDCLRKQLIDLKLTKSSMGNTYKNINLYKEIEESYPMNWVISQNALTRMNNAIKCDSFVNKTSEILINKNPAELKSYVGTWKYTPFETMISNARKKSTQKQK